MAKVLEKITHNWHLKLTAVILATLFWAALRREQPYSYTFGRVPVLVVNDDPDWVQAAPPDPAYVRVTLEGPGGELLQVASNPPEVRVPVANVSDSVLLQELRTAWVRFEPRPGTRVVRIEPVTVRLAFERLGAKLLPVAIELSGRPAEGWAVAGPPLVEPGVVRASGGLSRLARLEALRLPLSLDGRQGVDTLEIPVDTAGTGLVVSPNRVRVILSLRPEAASAGSPPGGP